MTDEKITMLATSGSSGASPFKLERVFAAGKTCFLLLLSGSSETGTEGNAEHHSGDNFPRCRAENVFFKQQNVTM